MQVEKKTLQSGCYRGRNKTSTEVEKKTSTGREKNQYRGREKTSTEVEKKTV